MNFLKKLFRDILTTKRQFITIALVVAVGSFFYAGLSALGRNFQNYSDKYYSDYNLADIWVYYSSAKPEVVDKVANIDGIEIAEGRYQYDVVQEFDDYTSTITTFSLTEKLNQLVLLEGNLPKKEYEIALDNEYAEANNINVNDKIVLTVNNYDMDMTVTALIESPEYLTKVAEDDVVPNHKKYGIAFIDQSTMTDINDGNQYPFNSIIISINDSLDANKIIDTISEETKDDTYLYAINRDLLSSYSAFASEVEQYNSLGLTLSIVFFLVSAIMLYITMKRMIASQRQQIGVMKALGYSNSKITGHYLCYPIIICIIGSLIGGFCGCFGVPSLMIELQKDTYDLPNITVILYTDIVFPSVILSILLGIIAVLISCKNIMRESVAAAMRSKAPKDGKAILLERISPFWNSLNGINRIVIRNIFSSKGKSALCMLGVIGSTALIITGFGMKNSVAKIVELQYEDMASYDIIAQYSYLTVSDDDNTVTYTDLDNIEVPNGISYYDNSSIAYRYEQNGEYSYGNIITCDDNYNDFYKVLDMNDKEANFDGGVAISSLISDKYGLKVGDNITLNIIDAIYGNVGSIDVEIRAISQQYTSANIYCLSDLLKEFDCTPVPLIRYINIDNSTMSEKEIKDFLKNQPECASVFTRQEQIEALNNVLAQMNVVVGIVIIGGLLLLFAVLTNISSITLLEKQRSLATMKVLGFTESKTASIITIENMIISIVGAIIGIPVGKQLLQVVLDTSKTDTEGYPCVLYPSFILISIVLVIVFTIIANFTIKGKCKKIDMVTSLKNAE